MWATCAVALAAASLAGAAELARTPMASALSSGGESAQAARADDVVVGFVESAEPDFLASTVEPLVTAIERALPGRKVRLARLSGFTVESDLSLQKPDLFIAPVASVVTLMDKQAVHPIATRKTVLARDPSRSVGGAVIVRASRTDLKSLDDLYGRRLAATLPNGIDGWLALADELNRTPDEAQRYFSAVDFFGYGMPSVISGVLSGAYDAGVIPACLLERAVADGLLESGALRVLSPKEEDSLACAHSTALFPDLVAAVLPETDPQLAKTLTIALLSTDVGRSGYSWQVTSDFHAVRALQEKLHLGAWAYLDDRSLAGLWARYAPYVVGAVAILGFLLLNEWRLRALVRRRTEELAASFAERDRLARAEEASREKIKQLEHMGAISQLCAMIAHELKQPVTSVINYAAILNLKLMTLAGDVLEEDETMQKALSGTEREARRIATIVDRVRAYARRDRSSHEPVNLGKALSAAIRESDSFRAARTLLLPAELPKDVFIMGHALEVELLFINILKNAHEALAAAGAMPADEKLITITLALTDDTVSVSIADNGPPISEANFLKLKNVSESVKPEGLGMGMAIVRNIVDEHGATMHVERRAPSGIVVTVLFSRLVTHEPKKGEVL